jgi:hypothetical protein
VQGHTLRARVFFSLLEKAEEQLHKEDQLLSVFPALLSGLSGPDILSK